MKKTVLIRLGVLIEVDEKEISKENSEIDRITKRIIESIDNTLNYDGDSLLGWHSSEGIPLNENEYNCGQCTNCGAWTSDREQANYIRELSIGARVNGKLFCDDCLPSDHPLAF